MYSYVEHVADYFAVQEEEWGLALRLWFLSSPAGIHNSFIWW